MYRNKQGVSLRLNLLGALKDGPKSRMLIPHLTAVVIQALSRPAVQPLFKTEPFRLLIKSPLQSLSLQHPPIPLEVLHFSQQLVLVVSSPLQALPRVQQL